MDIGRGTPVAGFADLHAGKLNSKKKYMIPDRNIYCRFPVLPDGRRPM
jgi:hypothetical protein